MLNIFTSFCCLLGLFGLTLSCGDSLLIVGGQDDSGPLSSLYLLTPSGWCQDVDFPTLPEPVTNPGVHIFRIENTDRHILIVCGFSSDPCRWSASGSDRWNTLPIQGVDSDDFPAMKEYVSSRSFQIVDLDDQSLMMVSTMEGDNYIGNTHTNTLGWFQDQDGLANPWVPTDDQTAEFRLEGRNAWNARFMKNMTGSCLARIGHEVLLSGGRTSELPMDSASRVKSSDASVGRMSPDGASNCDGIDCGPMWEQGVVPDLMEGREEHACLGTIINGEEVIVLGGGIKYDYNWGKSGWSYYTERETFETLKSVEVYHEQGWTSGGALAEARVGFGLAEMCGKVVAMGGRLYDGMYMWERQYNGPPDCGDPCWEETVTDTIQETFLDTMETMEGGTAWRLSDTKLPRKMANFGVAKVPTSLCKV